MSGMTNSEIRISNQTTMTNDEKEPVPSAFVIAFSPFIRHSDFVIRHWRSAGK